MHVGRKLANLQRGISLGRQVGRKANDYVVLAGANFLLLPESLSQYEVSIEFTGLQPGWRLVSSAGDDSVQPKIQFRNRPGVTADNLAELITAIGFLKTDEFSIAGLAVRLVGDQGTMHASGEIKQALLMNESFLKESLWPLNVRHTIILLQRPRNEDEVFVIAGASGQAIDLTRHLTPFLWTRLFENIASVWTRYPPTGLHARTNRDEWLLEGLTRYISAQMLSNAQIIRLSSTIESSYQAYLTDALLLTGDLRDSSHWDPDTRRTKAFLILELLNQEMRKKDSGLVEALRTLRKKSGILDCEKLLRAGGVDPSTDVVLSFISSPNSFITPEKMLGRPYRLAPLAQERVRETTYNAAAQPRFLSTPTGGYRFVVTGRTHTYIENCGCKANQNGGIARRQTVLKALRAAAPGRTVLIDAGDFFPPQINEPFMSSNAREDLGLFSGLMRRMRYDGVALGTAELGYPPEVLEEIQRRSLLPLLSANIKVPGVKLRESREMRVGTLPVRLIGVVDPSPGRRYRRFYEDALAEIILEDAGAACRRVLDAARPRRVLTVVVGSIPPLKVRDLIDRNQDIDVVISSEHFLVAPSTWPSTLTDESVRHILQGHEHSGYYKGTLVVYADQESYGVTCLDLDILSSMQIRSALVTKIELDSSIHDDRRFRMLIDQDYARRAAKSESERVPPLLNADPALYGASYVGAAACATCHESEYTQWGGTKHASAFLTLRHIRRETNPACVVCHVTALGYSPGFSMNALSKDAKVFGGIQCEVCHGPGSQHVAQPGGGRINRVARENVCRECHTREHSNGFVYQDRLARVQDKAGFSPGR